MQQEGNECVLPSGITWEDRISICTEEHRFASRRYDSCSEACEENEADNNGHCECDPNSLVVEDDSVCKPSW